MVVETAIVLEIVGVTFNFDVIDELRELGLLPSVSFVLSSVRGWELTTELEELTLLV